MHVRPFVLIQGTLQVDVCCQSLSMVLSRGLHLLARFPQLRYFGADPTIKEEVRDAYKLPSGNGDIM